MTCWRRLRDWQVAGVWDLIHRLRVRYDKRADIHEAFLSLGCALICNRCESAGRRPERVPLCGNGHRRYNRPRPMSLSAGTRLGPYEILSALGAGGMGEVYRAKDTKLKREVALKVLLPSVATDPDRLARFSREAQVLASLNHPNIAQIYGLEDSRETQALVMELVEGPTLADRVTRGAIPLSEMLAIARQVTQALEAAHEQGIVHRDLKPANIKVRPDGTVKVLDFGLAKALEPVSSMSADITAPPTITTPAMTRTDVILGTAAYMSPEQARGRPVDKQTDIWAFGCVLYEMLTGQSAFAGETTVQTRRDLNHLSNFESSVLSSRLISHAF